MQFIVCVSNGIWDFYVLCALCYYESRYMNSLPKREMSAQQTTRHSCSAEHAVFLALLQLSYYHGAQRDNFLRLKTCTLRNTLQMC